MLLTCLRGAPGLRAVGLCIAVLAFGTACDDEPRREGWAALSGSQDYGWLLSVWGPDSGELFMVGGPPDDGVIIRETGGAFTRETTPVVPRLNWVFGFGSDDIFAAGDTGTILHYDGADWTVQETPTTEALWGVWGAAPDDVWAVGGRGTSDAVATLLHYDGSSWTTGDLPEFERPGVTALFKVWGTSADNIYAVGRNGVIVHHDGSAWAEQSAGTGEDLIALWGTGPDEIVAVGGRGNGGRGRIRWGLLDERLVGAAPGTEWRLHAPDRRGPRGRRRGDHRGVQRGRPNDSRGRPGHLVGPPRGVC